ncbi:MAG: c-type cytochrome [Proteobacteria bacterium]|nr:c-type cytochrome [Pseudomonadota bacterium]
MKKFVVFAVSMAIMAISSSAVIAGDATKGAKLYKKKCKACHTIDGKKKVGPTLKGVLGRDSKNAGKLDEAGLTTWLKDPKKVFPKSKMAKLFKKKLKDGEIADLVAYLKTL